MDIYCKEQKDPKMNVQIPLFHLITLHIRKSQYSQKDLPKNVVVTRMRPTGSHGTLQDAKCMHLYGIYEPYHEEEKMDPLGVRKITPPSTISQGAIF